MRTVVDVGGGTGAMLTEILRAHPGVHGTLVDLPSTVARCPAGLTVEMVLLGGRGRPLDEFHALAAEAGLAVEAASRQPTGRFVVQCRRAA